MNYDVKTILAQHFLFEQLSADNIEALAKLASTRTYRKTEVVFMKGDSGDALMAVLSGRIRICSYSADGREVVLNVMNPGEVFGEIAMIDGGPRTADAFAMEKTELLILARREFMPFLERNPQISVKLLQVMCERLRWTSSQVEDFFFLHLGPRLAKRLLYLATHQKSKTNVSETAAIRFPQHLLASMIGTSREAVNKQLRAWQEAGLIDIHRGSITLINREALEDVVDEGEL
ncbi:MAG: Crp/Fnr family transcriptional regulator [Hyphomicrobiales bacterium]|nr:Crp/Fnr family transcriptional regulator [Hyphomicrobiales bacterium]